MNENGSAKAGVIGGILFVLIQISTQELLKTAVLATVGAAVSFCVSLLLRMVVKKVRGR